MVEEKHYYCGKNKVTLENPTVKELKESLPDDDYKVQFNGRDTFYIHFDQEDKLINLDYKKLDNHYGVRGGGSCANCVDVDRSTGACNCDPTNCINYRCPSHNSVDTKKEEIPAKSINDIGVESTCQTVVLENTYPTVTLVTGETVPISHTILQEMIDQQIPEMKENEKPLDINKVIMVQSIITSSIMLLIGIAAVISLF